MIDSWILLKCARPLKVLSQNEFFVPLRKDILRRMRSKSLDVVCLSAAQSKFGAELFHPEQLCIEKYPGFSVSDFTGHHLMCI